MSRVNTIIFSKRDYEDTETLYKKVAAQIRLLMEAEYVCILRDLDPKGGCIAIEYASSNVLSSYYKPYWLSPDEVKYLSSITDDQVTDIVTGLDDALKELKESKKSKDDKDDDHKA